MIKPNRLIISRVDSIGDVMLTLPIAGIIKDKFPDCEVYFMGSAYTKDVVKCSTNIDHFIDYAEITGMGEEVQIQKLRSINADTIIHVFPRKEIAYLAKKAKIKNRIGTSHRIYHLWTCNHLVSFSRKKSDLHEAQLNTKLFQPLFHDDGEYGLKELSRLAGFNKIEALPEEHRIKLDPAKFNLILHPKSKGSAREWGLDHFAELINILPEDRFSIFITGTEEEGKEIRKELLPGINKKINDLSGKLTLSELISFISNADGLIACSTGPLHIAAMTGIHAIGIYPPIKPMDPSRWAPIGEKTKVFVKDKDCEDCRKTELCQCVRDITPKEIADYCNSLSK